MKTILVIDDDDLDRSIMRRTIKSVLTEAVVHELDSGDPALEMIQKLKPDHTFLDLRMPGMDGFDVLSAVAASDLNPQPRIYVVSTSDHEKDRERALQLGCAGYCVKPDSRAGYRSLLESILVAD